MKFSTKIALNIAAVLLICGAGGDGCTQRTPSTAASTERAQQDAQMMQFLRNQPVPIYNWSLERHMLIKIYDARQKATSTFSVVQSELTGKVMWSCPSIGFPLPYATQLTNPQQVVFAHHPTEHDASGVVSQQEPNGLFSPAHSDATWVPCVNAKGQITPVYEERKVTVFLQEMQEINGRLTPAQGATASLSIDPVPQQQ